MYEQLTLDMFMNTEKPVTYGDRGCHVCQWWNKKEKDCVWHLEYNSTEAFPDCKFMPADYRGLHMCANCAQANCFIFEDKPEHNGDYKASMYDPLEEPNIYCDHPEGSLNRRTAYKDLEEPNFGVGHWHRQHEWDTCDRWEADE